MGLTKRTACSGQLRKVDADEAKKIKEQSKQAKIELKKKEQEETETEQEKE